MTKLILAPFDPRAPGSHRVRQYMARLARKAQEVETSKDPQAAIDLYGEIDDFLLPRLRTDDGTPVEAALDAISEEDYQMLLQNMGNVAVEDTVPLATTAT